MNWSKELISITMKKVIWSSPKPITFKEDPAVEMDVSIVHIIMKMFRKTGEWN